MTRLTTFLALCCALPALAAPLPEFTRTDTASWLNSPPLTVSHLRGKVVLIDVWTFECWNCYRSFPWLHDLARRYGKQGLMVVGIHSPELASERDLPQLKRKVAEFGFVYPVMIDNDFAYWRALGNQYWPAFYLVDKQGQIRYRFVGETHTGDAQAAEIEQSVASLLAQ